ncbi:hypothetical protein ACQUFY_11820 [Robbsia andropogonis]|uniref:hypothetical protein n=1 Tax=Robbsia andropogonis TaxID=28092 RepID=UPI003D242355
MAVTLAFMPLPEMEKVTPFLQPYLIVVRGNAAEHRFLIFGPRPRADKAVFRIVRPFTLRHRHLHARVLRGN